MNPRLGLLWRQDMSVEPQTAVSPDLARKAVVEKRKALPPSGGKDDHIGRNGFRGIKLECVWSCEPRETSAPEI
jgi:hypothetical protein